MDAAPPPYRLPRAWYSASFASFLSQSNAEVIGQLTTNSNVPVDLDQRNAWSAQIDLLKTWLTGRSGFLLLEFNIPRMGLRADAVLLLAGCVVILEFKVGEKAVPQSALNQVWEYALDTRNFHEPSHALPIVPVLIPTGYRADVLPPRQFAPDGVCQPIAISPTQLPQLLDELTLAHPTPPDAAAWLAGRVDSLIDRARTHGEKLIVFVTGVPGAGKTLVGLNIATSHRENNESRSSRPPLASASPSSMICT